jgi:hypothetical protein
VQILWSDKVFVRREGHKTLLHRDHISLLIPLLERLADLFVSALEMESVNRSILEERIGTAMVYFPSAIGRLKHASYFASISEAEGRKIRAAIGLFCVRMSL